MKYVFAVAGLLIIAPYFMATTGPDSIPCAYDRIVTSLLTIAGLRAYEEPEHRRATFPNCRAKPKLSPVRYATK